jgi:hypothetical protein
LENKLEKLSQLRAQKQKVENEIEQLVTELSGIIKPKKRQPKAKDARTATSKLYEGS